MFRKGISFFYSNFQKARFELFSLKYYPETLKNIRISIPFYLRSGLLISSFWIAHQIYNKTSNSRCLGESELHLVEEDVARLTKKDAKILIEQAKQLDAEGMNVKALELYKIALRVYRKANKASNRKMTFLKQRIAILTSFQGKHKAAVVSQKQSFEDTLSDNLTEELHFELYYDLCLMYYRYNQLYSSSEMFQRCLKLANFFHSEETEILIAIHQFLGFCYYRRGKISQAEEHLTTALRYLNQIKYTNPVFLYYACSELSDFYSIIGDYKKSLLFLEEARVVLNHDDFFSAENIQKGMKIHSPYTQKFIQDLRLEEQNEELNHKARVLRFKLGEYQQNNTKRNPPPYKLSKYDKDTHIHSLLHW